MADPHSDSDEKTTDDAAAAGAPAPAPAARFAMPATFDIAVRPTGRGSEQVVPNGGERRQPMRGFEDEYVDIVDWCVRITDRIWEDQDIGYIYDTYSPGCAVYSDSGMVYGVEPVVEGTIQSIHAFPDARHYADDIIWAGDEDGGFATSHRAINIGHHTGPWKWGPATGRRIHLWVIANCVSLENEIFEEWVLYNTGARLLQCGIDLVYAARRYGNEQLPGVAERQFSEVERLAGGRKPRPYPASGAPGFDVEHAVRGLFHDVFNRRDLSAIDRLYATTARWHGTTNREGYGRQAVRAMARALLATFPDLGLHVDEVYWMGNEADGFRVSVRWTATGTHRGHALYGEPTGRRVHLWGLSQLYFEGGQIVEDWMLFNEFDVMAQLLREEPLDLLSGA
jgi:predicted ester cyclase